MKNIIYFISLFLLFSCNKKTVYRHEFPKQIGYINDFENLLSTEEENNLEKIISTFQKETGNEIAIITINSIGKYTDFNKFALDLSNDWKVGKKDLNNGLTIVISKKLRNIRINTGNGTQNIISDDFCQMQIDNEIIPNFKKNDFYKGILNGLNNIIIKWKK